MKKLIGGILFSIPFILFLIFIVCLMGVEQSLIMLGVVIGFSILILCGAFGLALLTDD
jgi:hypothetical protein